jgi:hypothetical protein
VIDVLNKPAGKDVVTCGGGLDRVLADSKDVVSPDCEKVSIAPLPRIDSPTLSRRALSKVCLLSSKSANR